MGLLDGDIDLSFSAASTPVKEIPRNFPSDWERRCKQRWGDDAFEGPVPGMRGQCGAPAGHRKTCSEAKGACLRYKESLTGIQPKPDAPFFNGVFLEGCNGCILLCDLCLSF